MKRYVKEIANDCLRSLAGATQEVRAQEQERINRVLRWCNHGAMTDFEAVQAILKLTKE